jgi:hypothetical protein
VEISFSLRTRSKAKNNPSPLEHTSEEEEGDNEEESTKDIQEDPDCE